MMIRWTANDIDMFYKSPLGKTVSNSIADAIKDQLALSESSKTQVCGIGFTAPYLDEERQDHMILMPSEIGLVHWPEKGPRRVAQIDSFALPLPDQSVDVALVVHALENIGYIPDFLDELWRITKSNGHVIFITPNRHGLWVRSEKTPFGMGRPFSSLELRDLLQEARFVITKAEHALFFPPFERLISISQYLEPFGRFALGALGGVNIIHATKQVYAVPPAERSKKARISMQKAAGAV